jgi:hypothetical protein
MLRDMKFRTAVPALAVLILGGASGAFASHIDFSEAAVAALQTNTDVDSHVMHYSDPLQLFSLEGAGLSSRARGHLSGRVGKTARMGGTFDF